MELLKKKKGIVVKGWGALNSQTHTQGQTNFLLDLQTHINLMFCIQCVSPAMMVQYFSHLNMVSISVQLSTYASSKNSENIIQAKPFF